MNNNLQKYKQYIDNPEYEFVKYAEGGNVENQQSDGNKNTMINVEGTGGNSGGELEVNPKNFMVIKNFSKMPPHPQQGTDPRGNTVSQIGNIIIPKDQSKSYMDGDKLKRAAIINNLRREQTMRERDEDKIGKYLEGGNIYENVVYKQGGMVSNLHAKPSIRKDVEGAAKRAGKSSQEYMRNVLNNKTKKFAQGGDVRGNSTTTSPFSINQPQQYQNTTQEEIAPYYGSPFSLPTFSSSKAPNMDNYANDYQKQLPGSNEYGRDFIPSNKPSLFNPNKVGVQPSPNQKYNPNIDYRNYNSFTATPHNYKAPFGGSLGTDRNTNTNINTDYYPHDIVNGSPTNNQRLPNVNNIDSRYAENQPNVVNDGRFIPNYELEKDKAPYDYTGLQNVGKDLLKYSPSIYNLGKGLFDTTNTINPNDYKITNQMKYRPINMAPIDRKLQQERNIGMRNIREASGGNSGSYLSGAVQNSAAFGNARAEQEMKNQEANIRQADQVDSAGNSINEYNNKTGLGIRELNDNAAARRSDYLAKGFEGVSKITQDIDINNIMAKNIGGMYSDIILNPDGSWKHREPVNKPVVHKKGGMIKKKY